jgi:hypothetical protein
MKSWNELSGEQQKSASMLLKILGAVVVIGLIYLAVRMFI